MGQTFSDKITPNGGVKKMKRIPSQGKNGKKYVAVYRIGRRRKYIDETGQEWVKISGQWWRFPEEIEY